MRRHDFDFGLKTEVDLGAQSRSRAWILKAKVDFGFIYEFPYINLTTGLNLKPLQTTGVVFVMAATTGGAVTSAALAISTSAIYLFLPGKQLESSSIMALTLA